MFECDLHIHSIRSTCGFHTLLEIVGIMRSKGMKAFALTDHSPVHGTTHAHFSVMLRRLPSIINEVRVFKGIEATILTPEGDLDIPFFEDAKYEVIIAGLHDFAPYTLVWDKALNTKAVINVMRKYPEVKVITHPFFKKFPIDLDAVTDVACETNTSLEINNSYLLTGKADTEALIRLLEIVKTKGTKLCVNSDGHTFNEMGEFDLALNYLKPYGIENFTIVNRTLESTCEFLGLEK